MYLLKFFWFEFLLLVKDKVGAVWTFIFPLILVFALVPVYERFDATKSGGASLVIDSCGSSEDLVNLRTKIESYYIGDFVLNEHSDSLYVAKNYRIDLAAHCLQDQSLSSSFLGADIYRYNNDSSLDGFVKFLFEDFLRAPANTSAESIEVVDFSTETKRLPVSYFLISGILAITLTSTCLFGVATSIVGMRSSNTFKKYRMFPLSTIDIVLGFLLSRLMLMLLFSMSFISITFVSFGIPITLESALKLTLVTLLGILCFTTISSAISNFFSSPETISPLVGVLYFSTMIFGNIFFPAEMLPEWINAITLYYPPRVFVDAFRSAAFGVDLGLEFQSSLLVMTTWFAVTGIMSIKMFQWHAYAKN
ncbi:MAG: ABC-type multidrug transport system permease subunit [Flavobacteriales bacterium]|jgi:ABC-type multidrug transport system permease subunit